MKPFDHACFFSGTHMDVTGRLDAPARAGQSNPGRVRVHPGGAALNAASAAASLGLASTIASPVGEDEAARALHAALAARGIADALFVQPGHATGSYTAIIEPDGALAIGLADLSIYEAAGAQAYLSAGNGAAARAGLWYLPANLSADCLAGICAAARSAIRSAIQSADNPPLLAMAAVSPAKAERLRPVLAQCDLLFANRAEAQTLTGMADAEPADHAAALRALGVRAGVISDGPGPLVWWQGAETGAWIAPPVQEIADVNGAGDTLAGTLMAGLSRGTGFAAATRLAMAASRLVLAETEPYVPGIDWARLESAAIEISVHPLP